MNDRIRIGRFSFYVDNGGLLVIHTIADKEERDRFDPDEITKLWDFLSQHQNEFHAAVKASKPEVDS